MLEVKSGDDIIFVKKKYVKLKSDTLEPVNSPEMDEDFTLKVPTSISGVGNVKEEEEETEDSEVIITPADTVTPQTEKPTDLEVLRSKLRKSLEELEEVRQDMSATFTSTDTISNTITSLKGMLDALKKDQENLRSNLS